MTSKEFENLKIGDLILNGKRKARVTGLGVNDGWQYVDFRFLDTGRYSTRGYRGLKLIKKEGE